MKRMKDYGGMASCAQLAVKYGETKNFYNSGSVALARRVCEATGVNPNTRDDGTTQWWTILYTGRDAG
jgi:5-methylcytosine-specific restriction protein B